MVSLSLDSYFSFHSNIVTGPVKSLGLSFFIDMGSLLSKASFEEQGLALLENRVHGATKSAYLVNVNYVAWAHLRATDFAGMSGPMSKHLIKRQEEYERNIIAALNHITVLDPQTFPLFQALLTGVSSQCVSRVSRIARRNG